MTDRRIKINQVKSEFDWDKDTINASYIATVPGGFVPAGTGDIGSTYIGDPIYPWSDPFIIKPLAPYPYQPFVPNQDPWKSINDEYIKQLESQIKQMKEEKKVTTRATKTEGGKCYQLKVPGHTKETLKIYIEGNRLFVKGPADDPMFYDDINWNTTLAKDETVSTVTLEHGILNIYTDIPETKLEEFPVGFKKGDLLLG